MIKNLLKYSLYYLKIGLSYSYLILIGMTSLLLMFPFLELVFPSLIFLFVVCYVACYLIGLLLNRFTKKHIDLTCWLDKFVDGILGWGLSILFAPVIFLEYLYCSLPDELMVENDTSNTKSLLDFRKKTTHESDTKPEFDSNTRKLEDVKPRSKTHSNSSINKSKDTKPKSKPGFDSNDNNSEDSEFNNKNEFDPKLNISFHEVNTNINVSTKHKKQSRKPEQLSLFQEKKHKIFRVDFEKLNMLKKETGDLGEEIVVEFLRQKYVHNKNKNFKIRHVSKIEGDGHGYDIELIQENEIIKIEVKTTTKNFENNLFISKNEINEMNDSKDKYHLYRVYKLNKEKFSACLVILKGDKKIKEIFDFTPESYKGKIRKSAPTDLNQIDVKFSKIKK